MWIQGQCDTDVLHNHSSIKSLKPLNKGRKNYKDLILNYLVNGAAISLFKKPIMACGLFSNEQ